MRPARASAQHGEQGGGMAVIDGQAVEYEDMSGCRRDDWPMKDGRMIVMTIRAMSCNMKY